jgi:glycosyltransferase involved in cell wall biosynthesis
VSTARTVHVVVPDGIDDPTRPSGGNTYDRRLCDALAAAGWSVHVRSVAGDWPRPGDAARRALAGTLDTVGGGSVVLVDGLLASAAPDVMVPASARLRVVVLMHMPLGAGAAGQPAAHERAVVEHARAVVTTSSWSRRWLLEAYGLDPGRVHVARPGVDPAEPVVRGGDGTSLLCVAAVTPGKGHDVLLAALARVADRSWSCVCVGPVSRAPGFVAGLRRSLLASGLDGRVVLAGPRTGRALDEAYAAADALVLASRAETYGMVVTEALARAVPVLASDVGGVPEALGATADGRRPGLLTPPGDVAALAGSLRRWLGEADLRRDLRAAARERRTALTGWPETADRVASVLVEAAS